jgi:hypothetical protein
LKAKVWQAGLNLRHPEPHGIRTDKALYDFVIELKTKFCGKQTLFIK